MELALFVTFIALVGALATAFGADTRADIDPRLQDADRPNRD